VAARHCALIIALSLGLAGCATSELEPWHTARLTEDFRAGDEAGSFADYIEIERRAFDELDEEVYAEVGTGPEYALVRYSRGSLSDPDTFPQNYNRSYELVPEVARGGVLLLHGMSDSPYSLWALGESLHEAGFHVVNLRLPGHGTAAAALTRASWQDFAAATEIAMLHLHDVVETRPIHIVGFSNGGPLAVNYALDAIEDQGLPQAASLILIAPAIGVSAAAGFAGFKDFLGRIPGLTSLRYTQIRPEFEPFRYGAFPTNGATQTHRITRRISSGVSKLEREGRGASMPPMLVIKSAVDSTVSNDAVIDRLLGRLPDNGNEFLVFDVNRMAVGSSVIVKDPGPLASRLTSEGNLPFAVTLVKNESPDSGRVVATHKPAYASEFSEVGQLEQSWPTGVVSLSHIALTFPPDDPLYGAIAPEDGNALYLGSVTLRGERGILRVPDGWFTRQRFNPFYDYMEARILEWCEE
jgi:alpha-beta hydrolase superfamily lysophospholipase